MLKIIPPENNTELDKQIKALEWQIVHDASEKDRCIHLAAYDKLVKEKIRREQNE